MVVSTGARRSAMVLDFGLAAVMEQGEAKLRELRGTPAYMSPEHLRRQPLTPKCDLYAWGLIFLECLTGSVAVKRPSRGGTILEHLSERPVTIPPEIHDPALRRLLSKAMAKSPTVRYSSAEQILADLDGIKMGESSTSLPRLGSPQGEGGGPSTQSAPFPGATTRDVEPSRPGSDSDTAPIPDDD
jgi:serine/threonine protein kinase